MYSLLDLIQAYKNNNEKKDNYMYGDSDSSDTKKILGFSAGIFMGVLVLSVVIYIWAVIVLIQNWTRLPDWAKIVGALGVIPAVPLGPVVTLIVVYAARGGGGVKVSK